MVHADLERPRECATLARECATFDSSAPHKKINARKIASAHLMRIIVLTRSSGHLFFTSRFANKINGASERERAIEESQTEKGCEEAEEWPFINSGLTVNSSFFSR